MDLQAIWQKVTHGETLTDAEQTAWSNHWCTDVPVRAGQYQATANFHDRVAREYAKRGQHGQAAQAKTAARAARASTKVHS